MSTQNIKTRSGNRIIVYIDGNPIGLCQSVRLNDDYAPEPASGIGDIHVQEYVPTIARHSLSVSTMVLYKGALRQLGVLNENGDAALQGLIMDIVVTSKDDGSVLRKYVGCSHASGDSEITKHQIVMTSAQFMALDVQGTGL